MNKSYIISALKEEFPHLTEEYGVVRIGLFGSFVNEKSTATSDIDLLMKFKQPLGFRFFNLIDCLEKIFHRNIDILTPAGIKSIRMKEEAEKIMREAEYVKA